MLQGMTDPYRKCKDEERPYKRKLHAEDFSEFDELPHNREIEISEQGLIVVRLKSTDLVRPSGAILPAELEPFKENKETTV